MIALVEEPIEEVEATALTVADEAAAIQIESDMEFEAAGLFLRERVKAVLKEADDAFDPIITKAHAAHKEALAQKKRITAPLLEAERVVKRLMSGYVAEQERKRLAAESESRLLAEASEKQRQEEADALTAFGSEEEAAQVRAAAPILAALEEAVKPKAEGVSIRRRWIFELVDPSKLRPEFLVPDQVKIQKVVNALKGDAAIAVGKGAITVQEVSDVAVRV